MWEVKKKRKIDKAFKKLPLSIKSSFDILVEHNIGAFSFL